jgi:hypothetical protein
MRFVVELHRSEGDTIHGVVIAEPEGSGEPQPFTGWLELLRLLATLEPPPT